MIVHIANPIYDSVFKYLMEDERIARTILSALLKKEVVKVDIRRHEYTNGTRDNLSMFRIDFGARIRENDGKEHLVLIELQKTWLETETLRFRQYLGAQYANPENIRNENNPHGYGIPMITVYLLGHRVGNIEEPVLYVNHKSFDYDGNEINQGLPDPFVDSLVHDSIIVQIPLLRGQVNNRLEKVLSVFDQTYKDKQNRHILNIDEKQYEDDDDMLYILFRLLSAASDPKFQQDMNVEDECISAIEKRDTKLMQQRQQIQEKEKEIAKIDEEIARRNEKLAEKDEKIKKMVRLLKASGIETENIAQTIGIDITLVKKMLDE